MLTIGELSRATGTNISTIRYYEQMGLLTHASRSVGNQRRYTSAERDRLTFIRHARELGFTVEAIRELIDLTDLPKVDVDRIAAEQLVTIRGKIDLLKKLEAELVRISDEVPSPSAPHSVIRALSR
ncbi:helix-turn-helix domain-containing protein [Rhizobium laguerreae]|uniref:MerR family transcriptional regulator n=1 Tax=Rhizobium laguerreae TaxID=1076926 RepID=UPI001C8FB367|nr:helix-turn-helix domain-containing protein [Rhizobium laguerreae]MBY3144050.1 helix-turn-helix domain-containing protein [Rhizobium laguerreae]